jgi:hypothetical protein
MQKRTEITIETERLLVVSQRRVRAILWCNHCAKNVPMLTIFEADRISSLAEAGLLHFAVTPDGRLFICSKSLGLDRAEECSLKEPNINPTF